VTSVGQVSPAGQESPKGLSREAAVVARGSIVNLVAMVAGAMLSFGLVVLVSRWLQPAGAGALFELIALFTILSNTFELGADTGLTRWISRARAIGGLMNVRRVVLIAVIPVGIIGAGAAVAMWVTAPELARIFLDGLTPAAGAEDIRIVAPLVPLGALSSCIVDGARGFGRMWPYLAIEGLGKPAVRMALVLAALIAGLGIHGALIGWSAPVAIGLAAGCVIFVAIMRKEAPSGTGRAARRRAATPAMPAARAPARPARLPAPPRRAPRAEFPVTPELAATLELPVIFDGPAPPGVPGHDEQAGRGRHRGHWQPVELRSRRLAGEFWGFTGPRAFQATFQVVILWLDILLVGALVSGFAAGVYSAVSKLAIVGTFALEGNRLAIGPQLSALLARHEHDRAAALFQSATRWLMLASWPFYLVLAVFPTVILGIFGAKYTVGAAALTVLSLAMLVNLGTGNVTVVLLMGGKSSWSALNAGAALAVNIGLNLLLVPRMGILGAAIAWAASIVIDNVTAMAEVRWVLKMAPFGPGYLLVTLITVGCFGAIGIAARVALGETLPALIAGLGAGGLAYVAALYLGRMQLQLTGLFAALRMRAVPQARRQADQPAG
jgi:O-antigen/teichoic acid export membrane protein